METVTKTRARKPRAVKMEPLRAGRRSVFRDKDRRPVSVTLTPDHHTKVDKAMERLGVTRADLFGLLVERYAESVKMTEKQKLSVGRPTEPEQEAALEQAAPSE